MKTPFYRIVIVVAGLALLMDGLALVDFLLYPLARDYTLHSALVRAATILVLVPITLLVGVLIIRRVPGNVVGPLLIIWSGSVAFHSLREGIGPTLYGLYYGYDIVFGWSALFQLLLHFPDGTILPPGAARWNYRLLGCSSVIASLIFVTTDPLEGPYQPPNVFAVPALLPYAGWILGLGLLMIMPIMGMIITFFVLRYRGGSLRERQQIKWLALFGGVLVIYTLLVLIAYPLMTGGVVMTQGATPAGALFYFLTGLLPPLAIGVSVLRYRLWDIDRIIRRTLVYSILTVILALIYFGSVIFLQTIFGLFFQLRSNDLAIVLSTLAIAAAFTPLRGSIQQRIDQRFFRQKYSYDQTIAGFAAIARTEVVLEPLAGALLANVERTIHPEGVSLWLMKSNKKRVM